MYFFPRQCFDVICESCPVKLLWTSPDLKFRWEDGEKSVQMSPDVALPQFNILGHRQRIVEASLSSGNFLIDSVTNKVRTRWSLDRLKHGEYQVEVVAEVQ